MSKGKGQRTKEGPKANPQAGEGKSALPNVQADYAVPLNGQHGAPWQMREEPAAPSAGRIYDLLERTAVFGEAVVRFAKKIPRSPANDRLIGQFVDVFITDAMTHSLRGRLVINEMETA